MSSETSTAPLPRTLPAQAWFGLPRVYWLIWVGMLINRIGGCVFPFISLYLTRALGFSPAAAGGVVSLFAAGGMVAGPVGGLLADRIGRRKTVLFGSAAAATLMFLLGAARAPATIAVLAFFLGFATDVSRPALSAAVADVVPPADRMRAYGLFYWVINLGFAIAALAAGRVAEWSYTLLFVIDGVTTLLFGLVVLLGVPETRPARAPDAPARPLHDLVVPLRDVQLRRFLLIQLMVMLAFLQLTVAFPLDMAAKGISATAIGRILALNGVVIIVVQPLVLRWGWPVHRLLAVGGALTGLGLGLAALATPATALLVFVAALVVLTLGEIGFSSAAPALVAGLAPAAHRGGYQGANQLMWSASGVAAPALGSWVLGHHGADTLWLVCAGLGLVAAALHLTFTRAMVSDSR